MYCIYMYSDTVMESTWKSDTDEAEMCPFTCFHPQPRSSSAWSLEAQVLTDKLLSPFANNNIDCPPTK